MACDHGVQGSRDPSVPVLSRVGCYCVCEGMWHVTMVCRGVETQVFQSCPELVVIVLVWECDM